MLRAATVGFGEGGGAFSFGGGDLRLDTSGSTLLVLLFILGCGDLGAGEGDLGAGAGLLGGTSVS